VVEDVEEIRARLKRKALLEFELPAHRQIDPRRPESVEGVPSQISLDRPEGVVNAALLILFPPATYGSTSQI